MSSVMFKKHLHQHLLLRGLPFHNTDGDAGEIVHNLFAMNKKMCKNVVCQLSHTLHPIFRHVSNETIIQLWTDNH